MHFQTYSEIQQYRIEQMNTAAPNHFQLNELHEVCIKLVLSISLKKISDNYGPPPSSFSFFVMGSAGRFEQSIWSDQDHGIIYQIQSDQVQSYFLKLGEEIAKGLDEAGYDYCDGGVMSCNRLWCKSLAEWERQLENWLCKASWESIRHLLIFIDGRSVYGEKRFIDQLKDYVYQKLQEKHLLVNILSNTMFHKKGISVLGHILTETHGPHSGSFNIKEIALLPFVNTVRLLAIKENVKETTTLSRLDNLSQKCLSSNCKELYKQQFLKLLNYRLLWADHSDYQSGHFLPIHRLSKEQKEELKGIIKHGEALFKSAKKLVEKDDIFGQK